MARKESSHNAPVHFQSPQISRSYAAGGSGARRRSGLCERRTSLWRKKKGRLHIKSEWLIKMYTVVVSRKLYSFNLGNKWLTHLSLRLRNQYPLPGVTVIFPFLLTDFLATPRSQSVFPVTSTCSKPHPGFVRSLVDAHSEGSHLPVVSPRWHHLLAQHADDPVKPLLVVGQQLVLISAPNLHKHSPLMQNLPHHLKTHSHTHGSHLTLFMSSDMISLGWAVLTSSVTSTVETIQKEATIALAHVWVSEHCGEVSNLHTPAASSSLQKHVAKILLCALSFIVLDHLRQYCSAHSLGCGCTGLTSVDVMGKPARTNKECALVFALFFGLGCWD